MSDVNLQIIFLIKQFANIVKQWKCPLYPKAQGDISIILLYGQQSKTQKYSI